MLKIALVTPVLPVPYDRARGQFILETARALSKITTVRTYLLQSEYFSSLSGLRPKSFVDGKVPRGYKIAGLDMETIHYPVVPYLSRGLNPFVSTRRLTPRVREFGPDVVLGYWIYPDGYAAQLTAQALGVPNVLGALGSDIHERHGFRALMSRKALRRADAVITVSQAMTEAVINQFGASRDRVTTVVNGFNPTVFYPRPMADMRSKHQLDPNKKVIIYVGRLVDAKGVKELVDAFTHLYRRDTMYQLVIGGDGVMRADLQALVKARQLETVVRFTGNIKPETVAEYICAADVLTLPSWTEGYPNVVVEALACGTPTVVTSVGGIPEIVNSSNGVFVEVRDAESLRNGLEHACFAQWDRQAIASAIKRSWDDVARESLQVIMRTVEKARPATSLTAINRAAN